MYLDQRRTDIAEQRDRHRLVVDEGATAAVSALHAAQDEIALCLKAALLQQITRGMARRHVEHGSDIALRGTSADHRGIAAPAKRQRQCIEQDRLAGAGLAGEHGQAGGEIDVELVDDDDVADRKGGQHAAGGYARAANSWLSQDPLSSFGSYPPA